MKLVASRILDRSLWDLNHLPGGEVVTLMRSGNATFLEAFDANLEPVWSKHLEPKATALTAAADGTLWVLNETGASTYNEQGDLLVRTEGQRHQGMRLRAFAPVDNGFVFAWQQNEEPICAPILERVNYDGTVRWSITLPITILEYKGITQMSADEGWIPRPIDPWRPVSWLSYSRILKLSGDAVLACFSDMAGSGIGFGYVVSLSDGVLRFTTEQGPISEVAALGGGAFLVGYQGYDSFETLLYERDGRVRTRWASHGYYVIREEDIRVIELKNCIPSKSHLVRLLPDGLVEKGDWLDGYYTSPPFLRSDGTMIFVRKGVVIAARDIAIDERLEISLPDDSFHSNTVVGDDRGIYFAYDQHRAKDAGACLVRIAF